MSRASWWCCVAGLLVVGGVIFAMVRGSVPGKPSADAPGMSSAANAPPVVAATTVIKGTIDRQETFQGEFFPFDRVELHPRVAGFLKSISVDEGDQVKEGQLLAVLDVPTLDDDLARARAQVERDSEAVGTSKATYDQAHQTLARLQGVAKQQAQLIAQQDIDEAQSRDDGMRASWKTVLGQVEVAKADLAKLLALKGYCQVTAPFPGVVTRRFADPGALVNGGVGATAQNQPLLTIARVDLLRLSFPVAESLVPRIHVGSMVEVAIEALKERRSAKISRFTQRIENATRTMEVEADVANGDLRITPGMYASVSLVIESHADALLLPLEAVKRKAQSAFVYAIAADQRVEERPVTLGMESPATLEILSGLREGDQVVFGSFERVKPGEKIQPLMVHAKGAE